jgi:uncharacterized membrane protein YozB (DUF420 family)
VTGQNVILFLKVAVLAVTILLLASLAFLASGNSRLHGRINIVFFILTAVTLIGFEMLIRVIKPELFDYIQQNEELNRKLVIHLRFAIPSALMMPFMLLTGLRGMRTTHILLACVFSALWLGTFITGVFTLPHTE